MFVQETDGGCRMCLGPWDRSRRNCHPSGRGEAALEGKAAEQARRRPGSVRGEGLEVEGREGPSDRFVLG